MAKGSSKVSISKVGIPKAPKPALAKTPTFANPKAPKMSTGMKAYIQASKLS